MSQSEYADRVKKIIASTLNREGVIREEDKIIEDLGADSLDVVELTMNLEEEFGIKIQDDESELITTVGEAIEAVEKKIGHTAIENAEAPVAESKAEGEAVKKDN